jgi:hypothetical protein
VLRLLLSTPKATSGGNTRFSMKFIRGGLPKFIVLSKDGHFSSIGGLGTAHIEDLF